MSQSLKSAISLIFNKQLEIFHKISFAQEEKLVLCSEDTKLVGTPCTKKLSQSCFLANFGSIILQNPVGNPTCWGGKSKKVVSSQRNVPHRTFFACDRQISLIRNMKWEKAEKNWRGKIIPSHSPSSLHLLIIQVRYKVGVVYHSLEHNNNHQFELLHCCLQLIFCTIRNHRADHTKWTVILQDLCFIELNYILYRNRLLGDSFTHQEKYI